MTKRALLVVAAGLVVYANSLRRPFMFDDHAAIIDNPAINELVPIEHRLPRESPVAGRPLAHMSFAINYAIDDLDPVGYHVVNVAIHIACGLLILAIARRMFGDDDVACTIALLWIVHPLTTEAVTYITERTESLMAMFLLLTLYCSIRGWTAAAIAACAAGMACKESMAPAPVIVIVYDRIFRFGSWRSALRQRWPLYVGLAATWLVVAASLALTSHSASVQFTTTTWPYLLNQTVMIVRYLRLAIWPTSLVLHYGWTKPLTLREVLPQATLVMTLLIATAVALWRWPKAGFAGFWFFALLAPTSSIVPIATEVGAERRMYLPLVAIVALAVAAAQRVPRRIAVASVAIAAVALGSLTVLRNQEYVSPLRIAETVVARWPTGVAHAMLGQELAQAARHDEAIAELREAAPDYPRAEYDLGGELFNTGRQDEAVGHLEAFIAREPMLAEVPQARLILGEIMFRKHRWADAQREFEQVLAMTPGNMNARRALVGTLTNEAIDLAQRGRSADALALFRRAVEADPSDERARRNLAEAERQFDTPAESQRSRRR